MKILILAAAMTVAVKSLPQLACAHNLRVWNRI